VSDAAACGLLRVGQVLAHAPEPLCLIHGARDRRIAHDISVPLSRIPEFIERADAAVEKAYPGVRHCCFGHVGDGNLHYNPIRPVDWTYERFHAEYPNMNKIVHDIVVSLGGSISAEHGIGRLRLAENLRYKSAVEIELMRTLKRAFDPLGIMSPGRVVPDS
jgi:FAD/FMN-containing dehydrogenase